MNFNTKVTFIEGINLQEHQYSDPVDGDVQYKDGDFLGYKNGSWISLTTGATISNNLYALSGSKTGTSYTTSLYAYDIGGNSWSTKAVYDTAIRYPGFFNDGTDVFACGGESSGVAQRNDCDFYDVSGNSWTAKTTMGTSRSRLASTQIDAKGYAIGGSSSGNPQDDNEEYDPVGNSWATKTVMTADRTDTGAGFANSKAFYIGGYNSGVQDDVYEYSPSGNSWATKAVFHENVYLLFSIVSISDKIYVPYGYNGSSNRQDNREYTESGDSWAQKATTPTAPARRIGCSGENAGSGYFAGGYSTSTIADTDVYDPVGDTWVSKVNMTETRTELGGVAV